MANGFQLYAHPRDPHPSPEVTELRRIAVATEGIDASLKQIVRLLTPKRAMSLNATVEEIPRGEN